MAESAVDRMFEWDERKRVANLEKHGFDFRHAVQLFDGPHVLSRATTIGDEARWQATGLIGDTFATAIFTYRGSGIRLISIRRARNGERREYQAIHGS